MLHRASVLGVAFAVFLGLAGPAHAQITTTFTAPLFEFSAGYQLLRVSDESLSDTIPNGFALDGARYWGPLGLAFEFGWSSESTAAPGVSLGTSFLHFAGGPRLLIVPEARVRPYVQVLAGLSRANYESQIEINDVIIEDLDETDSAFLVQPGAGLTFVLTDVFGVFGSVDYRRSFYGEGPGLGYGNTNEIRVFLGARLIFD